MRLGVVSFLNCVPLYRTLLGREEVEIVERLPSELTELLETGAVDAALLPLFEYFRGVGDALVPGVSISSDGPVASVTLFLKKPIRELRSVAVDRGSRSSVALLRVLLRERYGATPNLTSRRAQLDPMLASFDAALLIGDDALRAQRRSLPQGVEALDLGTAWTEWTRLPFVYAAWTTRAGLAPGEAARLAVQLNEARDAGEQQLDDIAEEHQGRGDLDHDGIVDYLTRNIRTGFDARYQQGAEQFARLCVKYAVLPRARALRFCA